jgi:two-component sensor histidine kinase
MSVFAKDITEQKKAEKIIADALAEKHVLLREIHHRVKNNMQVIVSLLNMQRAGIRDPELAAVLVSCQERIRAMALVHENLYRSDDLALIKFADYLEALVRQVERSIFRGNIVVTCTSDQTQLPIDTAIPLGLIVTELVSNSIKYAFPDGKTGHVAVSFTLEGSGRALLAVSDDGIGMPDVTLEELQNRREGSIGLHIVTLLAEQLGGVLTVGGDGGMSYRLSFPISRAG